MTNVTSYLNGGGYLYKRYQLVENNSGASGASCSSSASGSSALYGVSGASNSSGSSGISGSSSVSGVSGSSASSGSSGVSGASSYYQYVSIGSVENLTIDEVISEFTRGDLTKGEMQKWLKAHASNYTYSESNSLLSFNFTYNNKDYSVSCSTKAVESQLDKVT